MISRNYECCILGAGPAGLGAALELVKHGIHNIVIIDRHAIVGGLSRTEQFDGVRFDIGPHRFFTKNTEVNKVWHDTLGSDFRPVSRLTRIFYSNKYFDYPIKALDTLIKLGPIEAITAIHSFCAARLRTPSEPANFEDCITQRFGRKVYETFFKTYTEKVWGIPCRRIGAEWADQRIKDLNVIHVIKHALFAASDSKIKTLVEEFDYPVLGAGQMYEAMGDIVSSKGAEILVGSRVIALNRHDNVIESIDVTNGENEVLRISAKRYFSSLPITCFFEMLTPRESQPIRDASSALYFRDHITVNLLVDGTGLFPDQWIYIHSPDVKMARIANYNNFSQAMVSGKQKTALSVEYFVFQGDDIWKMSNQEILDMAADEIRYLKLLQERPIEKAWIVRETESYPTYYVGFQEPYAVLKARLDQFDNLSSIGRGGMYKYNNQDHSLMTGILAARNYLNIPGSPYNLWNINVDAEYHEDAARKKHEE